MADKIEILNVLNECEPYVAADVAAELEIPRRTADYHLRNLAEEGRIRRKKHSARRVTYWVD